MLGKPYLKPTQKTQGIRMDLSTLTKSREESGTLLNSHRNTLTIMQKLVSTTHASRNSTPLMVRLTMPSRIIKKRLNLALGDGRVYQELGQLYLRKNDLEAAEKAFQEALQYAAHDGERHNIERQLMNLYRRQGKLEEMLKEAEATGALTFEMKMEQARNYSNQGKLDEAVSAYKKALEMTTREWERENAERGLMHLYRRQGTLEEVLKEAEKNDTLTFTMQTELARHYRSKGESEKAVSAYKQALNMTTQNHERNRIAIELMQEYARSGENDLAIELYESASHSDSSTRSIRHGGSTFIVKFGGDEARDGLIKAYKNQGKLEELKTLFEKKLEENPNNPATLEMIG